MSSQNEHLALLWVSSTLAASFTCAGSGQPLSFVGMQMDVCYPGFIRLSPVCLAFSVSPEPLSPRCGQGSCCPEPVPVWNGGWHIRAPGALSLWGNAAVSLWMTGTRGKEILDAAAVSCSSALLLGRELHCLGYPEPGQTRKMSC